MKNLTDQFIVDKYKDPETGVIVKVYESCATSDGYEAGVREATKDFIARTEKKFPDRYLFDGTRYTGASSLVSVTCKKHLRHIRVKSSLISREGLGCSLCSFEEGKANCGESFELLASAIHKGKYTYNPASFTIPTNRVDVRCPEHGNFKIQAERHLNGEGCPLCE